MSDYQNRGGEIWERCKDGQWRELFAEDAIGRLMHLERGLAEVIAQRHEALEALEGLIENHKLNNGRGFGIGPKMKAKAAIAKLKGKNHE